MNWFQRLLKKDELERQLDAELRFHYDCQVADNVTDGMGEQDARRNARLQFGGIEQIKEECRDARGTRWNENLFQDIRFALRLLRKSPGFTITAVATLALGIGANTAVYNIVYDVLIQPLPFYEPDELVQVWETHPSLRQVQVTVPDFEEWKTQTRCFDQMAAYTLQAMNKVTLIGAGEPEVIQATMATSDLFSMMGIEPLLGRTFTAEEERTKQNVGLISEKLWRTHFGADPAIVGKRIQLETETFTVIGVISDRQRFPVWADFWMPSTLIESELRETRKYHPLEVIARLKRGVTSGRAQTEMQAVAQRLANDHPDTNGTIGAYVIPIAREMTGDVQRPLLIVWAVVGLVLVIACANLAHLVLSRMLVRHDEIEIRAALGAGSIRVIQQVLTENLLLAILGAGAGWSVAVAGTKILQNIAGDYIPRMTWVGFHGPVLLFAISVSLVCSVLFGLPAAWSASSVRTRIGISRRSSRSVTRARARLSSTLMVAEIALAFVVVAGAILLVRSFALLLNENPGFRAEGVFAIQVPLPSSRYHGDQVAQFFTTRLIPGIKAVPGVQEVAATNSIPMTLGRTEHGRFATRFGIKGRMFEPGQFPIAQARWVTPEYFHTLRIPLRKGRWLTEADRDKPRYLINETLARRFFPNQDATTKRLIIGVMDPHQDLVEIAGVVGDVREMGLDQEVEPTLYMIGTSPVMTLLLRTAQDPRQIAQAVRKVIQRADPLIAITQGETLDGYVSDSLARRRFALRIVVIFAGISVFLAAAGIYGSMAYTVGARIRELGVRAAMGATPSNLLGMILGEAVAIAVPGLAVGAVLSIAVARLMRTEVYQLSPTDAASMINASILLTITILLSAWPSAGRAARMDVGSALRAD
jgi:putative ABC transport system permease protein